MKPQENKSVVLWVRITPRHHQLIERQMKDYGYKSKTKFIENLLDSLEAERQAHHDRKSKRIRKCS